MSVLAYRVVVLPGCVWPMGFCSNADRSSCGQTTHAHSRATACNVAAWARTAQRVHTFLWYYCFLQRPVQPLAPSAVARCAFWLVPTTWFSCVCCWSVLATRNEVPIEPSSPLRAISTNPQIHSGLPCCAEGRWWSAVRSVDARCLPLPCAGSQQARLPASFTLASPRGRFALRKRPPNRNTTLRITHPLGALRVARRLRLAVSSASALSLFVSCKAVFSAPNRHLVTTFTPCEGLAVAPTRSDTQGTHASDTQWPHAFVPTSRLFIDPVSSDDST